MSSALPSSSSPTWPGTKPPAGKPGVVAVLNSVLGHPDRSRSPRTPAWASPRAAAGPLTGVHDGTDDEEEDDKKVEDDEARGRAAILKGEGAEGGGLGLDNSPSRAPLEMKVPGRAAAPGAGQDRNGREMAGEEPSASVAEVDPTDPTVLSFSSSFLSFCSQSVLVVHPRFLSSRCAMLLICYVLIPDVPCS